MALQASQQQDANGKKAKKWGVPRIAAGEKWYDPNLADWPEGDFRIFVGDMGNEVNDDTLHKAFNSYATMQRACIVKDKRTNKSKGQPRTSLRLPCSSCSLTGRLGILLLSPELQTSAARLQVCQQLPAVGLIHACSHAASVVLHFSMALWSLSGASLMLRLSCPCYRLCRAHRTCIVALCSALLSGKCITPCC